MANTQTVILQGDIPEVISQLPCVKRFGDNPIQDLEHNDIRAMYGDTIIYTFSASIVLDKLIELGYNKHDLFWQDLDNYGANKIFQRQ